MIQQPSALQCFVCGVENEAGLHVRFFETEGDSLEVQAQYCIPAHYQGYPGVAHGGIVAALLDETATRSVFRGDPPRFVVTAKLAVRYRRPVPLETPLRLVGRIREERGKVITVESEIRGMDGAILADAEAVLREVDAAFFGDALNQQGWQVYADEDPLAPPPGVQIGEEA